MKFSVAYDVNTFHTWHVTWINAIFNARVLKENYPDNREVVNHEWKVLHMYRAFGI